MTEVQNTAFETMSAQSEHPPINNTAILINNHTSTTPGTPLIHTRGTPRIHPCRHAHRPHTQGGPKDLLLTNDKEEDHGQI
jgi:hypothetical protein